MRWITNVLVCHSVSVRYGYTLVTPTGDQPATAVRSRTLTIFTKAQWNCRKCSPQCPLDSLSLQPSAFSVWFQYALNASKLRVIHSLCAQVALTALSLRVWAFGSCMYTITKVNSSHTCLRSWWRSHCVFYSIKARCKANQGLWERIGDGSNAQ